MSNWLAGIVSETRKTVCRANDTKNVLTKEQVEQLKAAHQAFEFNWLAKHKSGLVAAFKRKPVKGNNGCWFVDALAIGYDFGLVVREGSLICSLVSWSDPEPLDIVAALKAAGVEVE